VVFNKLYVNTLLECSLLENRVMFSAQMLKMFPAQMVWIQLQMQDRATYSGVQTSASRRRARGTGFNVWALRSST
jgi:hypothetical protein